VVDAGAAWAGLNTRQQEYLQAILAEDQAVEAEIKARRARWERVPPAAEWRLVTFSIALPARLVGYSTVVERLRQAGHHDPGAGSTLSALRRRDLVEVEHDKIEVRPVGWVDRVRVRLTRDGRATARAGAGVTAPAATPAGMMGRWSLLALARLYAAGEQGLAHYSTDREKRAPSHNTLLQLERRKEGSFYESSPGATRLDGGVRISAAGRRHYELHAGCYREFYGDEIEGFALPEPQLRSGAHAGLAEHKAPRPKHLLREPDLRVLAALVKGGPLVGHLRRIIVEDQYEQWDLEVPERFAAIPDGLMVRQVRDLARSDKPIERLAAHPQGPLIEVVQVPNAFRGEDGPATLPLVTLTAAGQDHYQAHVEEYRAVYPETRLPKVAPTDVSPR
jgi:hypothetical protein